MQLPQHERKSKARRGWDIIERSARNTPDWLELKASNKFLFPVLVTGHCKHNKDGADFMEDSVYYGHGVTWDNNFIMKKPVNDTKHDPLVFHFPRGTEWPTINHVFEEEECKAIEGDVYGVPLRQLANMDLREHNTDGITRQEVWVSLKHKIHEGHQRSIRCFMYTVDIEYFIEWFSYTTDLRPCNAVRYAPEWAGGKETSAYYF